MSKPQNGQNRPSALLTYAAFAKRVGVSRNAVNKAAREGELQPAVVDGRIDAGHPAAVAYANKDRAVRQTAAIRSTRRTSDPMSENGQLSQSDTDGGPTSNGGGMPDYTPLVTDTGLDISRYADMTLRELVERFGSVRALKDWLEALKKIEDIREKRLNNEEVQRSLISRELVQTHVFGFLDAGNRRLLGDASKTIARRLYALARSGEPVEAGEKLVREIIGSQLEPQKKRVAKLLRDAG